MDIAGEALVVSKVGVETCLEKSGKLLWERALASLFKWLLGSCWAAACSDGRSRGPRRLCSDRAPAVRRPGAWGVQHSVRQVNRSPGQTSRTLGGVLDDEVREAAKENELRSHRCQRPKWPQK